MSGSTSSEAVARKAERVALAGQALVRPCVSTQHLASSWGSWRYWVRCLTRRSRGGSQDADETRDRDGRAGGSQRVRRLPLLPGDPAEAPLAHYRNKREEYQKGAPTRK